MPGSGMWSVLVQAEATTDLDPLTAAFGQPDEPATDGICPAYADVYPQLWLVNEAGDMIRPRWPRDSCGHIPQSARQALERVEFVETSRRHRLRLVTPQAAIDTGCSTDHKPVVAIAGGDREPPTRAGSFGFTRSAEMPNLCRYRVEESTDGEQIGVFDRGERVGQRRWSDLVDLLESTGPARPCTGVATRFVLLAGEAAVELDGCRRILTPDGALRQADGEVLSAVRVGPPA